jgi:hypothetical protein
MVILCSFKQNGIEGQCPWRVVASSSNERSWFGASIPKYYITPLNQQLPHYKGEKYDT